MGCAPPESEWRGLGQPNEGEGDMYGRASYDLLRRRVLGLETSPGSDFSCAGTRNHAWRSYTLGKFPRKIGGPAGFAVRLLRNLA